MSKLSYSEVKVLREKLKRQGTGYCPLCQRPWTKAEPVLDHDHDTGYVRELLCRNCNGMEGRVMNFAQRGALSGNSAKEWLDRLIKYLDKHSAPKSPYIHPTHRTDEEKREARNAKARKKRKDGKK